MAAELLKDVGIEIKDKDNFIEVLKNSESNRINKIIVKYLEAKKKAIN